MDLDDDSPLDEAPGAPVIEQDINALIGDRQVAVPALKLLTQWVDDRSKSDVIFKVGNCFTGIELIHGIRSLFGNQSKVFENMLLGEFWLEASPACQHVIIDDIAPRTFAWLKLYIYGCNPRLTLGNVGPVMNMADKYFIGHVYEGCVKFLWMTCQALFDKRDVLEFGGRQCYALPLQAMRRMAADMGRYTINTNFVKKKKKKKGKSKRRHKSQNRSEDGNTSDGSNGSGSDSAAGSDGGSDGGDGSDRDSGSDSGSDSESGEAPLRFQSQSFGISSSRPRTMEAIAMLGPVDEPKENLLGKLIAVVKQKDRKVDKPELQDLEQIGYVAEVVKVDRYSRSRGIEYSVAPRYTIQIHKLVGRMVLWTVLHPTQIPSQGRKKDRAKAGEKQKGKEQGNDDTSSNTVCPNSEENDVCVATAKHGDCEMGAPQPWPIEFTSQEIEMQRVMQFLNE